MIIVKCEKKDCKGHLVGFTAKGKPVLLRNRDHKPTDVKVTEDLRERIAKELNTEPFATFMDVLRERGKKK